MRCFLHILVIPRTVAERSSRDNPELNPGLTNESLPYRANFYCDSKHRNVKLSNCKGRKFFPNDSLLIARTLHCQYFIYLLMRWKKFSFQSGRIFGQRFNIRWVAQTNSLTARSRKAGSARFLEGESLVVFLYERKPS